MTDDDEDGKTAAAAVVVVVVVVVVVHYVNSRQSWLRKLLRLLSLWLLVQFSGILINKMGLWKQLCRYEILRTAYRVLYHYVAACIPSSILYLVNRLTVFHTSTALFWGQEPPADLNRRLGVPQQLISAWSRIEESAVVPPVASTCCVCSSGYQVTSTNTESTLSSRLLYAVTSLFQI
jgi:hypothetical protein